MTNDNFRQELTAAMKDLAACVRKGFVVKSPDVPDEDNDTDAASNPNPGSNQVKPPKADPVFESPKPIMQQPPKASGPRNFAQSHVEDYSTRLQAQEPQEPDIEEPEPEPEYKPPTAGPAKTKPLTVPELRERFTPSVHDLFLEAATYENELDQSAAADWLEEQGVENIHEMRQDPEWLAVKVRELAYPDIDQDAVRPDRSMMRQNVGYGGNEVIIGERLNGDDEDLELSVEAGTFTTEDGTKVPVYRWVRRDLTPWDNVLMESGPWVVDPVAAHDGGVYG